MNYDNKNCYITGQLKNLKISIRGSL